MLQYHDKGEGSGDMSVERPDSWFVGKCA